MFCVHDVFFDEFVKYKFVSIMPGLLCEVPLALTCNVKCIHNVYVAPCGVHYVYFV